MKINRKIIFALSTWLFILLTLPIMAQLNLNLSSLNGINDIDFPDCNSITTLDFSGTYGIIYQGNNKYTWSLYRDNTVIATMSEFIPCNTKCFTNSPCAFPISFFQIPNPLQGAYKVRLEVEKAFFVNVFCLGTWISLGVSVFDGFSNIINVTRFDDGFECTCNMPFNINVNCFTMNMVHGFGMPFTARARNNLEVGCTIPSGKTSTFIAENRITSKSGFHARAGSNVHVYIDDCPGINKTSWNESVPDTIGVIDVDDAILLDTTKIKPSLDVSDGDTEEQGSNVKIYPNPTTGKFVVEITETDIVSNSTIFIYNVLGEIIYKKNVSTPIMTIDLSSYSKGIYYLNMVNENNIFRGKIIYQ